MLRNAALCRIMPHYAKFCRIMPHNAALCRVPPHTHPCGPQIECICLVLFINMSLSRFTVVPPGKQNHTVILSLKKMTDWSRGWRGIGGHCGGLSQGLDSREDGASVARHRSCRCAYSVRECARPQGEASRAPAAKPSLLRSRNR